MHRDGPVAEQKQERLENKILYRRGQKKSRPHTPKQPGTEGGVQEVAGVAAGLMNVKRQILFRKQCHQRVAVGLEDSEAEAGRMWRVSYQ